MGEATLFDDFPCFLDKMGVAARFPALDPLHAARASNVRFHTTLLIYLMRATAHSRLTGIRKLRGMVRQESAKCLIVFGADRYAIFEAYKISILLGRRVRMPRGFPETIAQEDFLRKHGVLRE